MTLDSLEQHIVGFHYNKLFIIYLIRGSCGYIFLGNPAVLYYPIIHPNQILFKKRGLPSSKKIYLYINSHCLLAIISAWQAIARHLSANLVKNI